MRQGERVEWRSCEGRPPILIDGDMCFIRYQYVGDADDVDRWDCTVGDELWSAPDELWAICIPGGFIPLDEHWRRDEEHRRNERRAEEAIRLREERIRQANRQVQTCSPFIRAMRCLTNKSYIRMNNPGGCFGDDFVEAGLAAIELGLIRAEGYQYTDEGRSAARAEAHLPLCGIGTFRFFNMRFTITDAGAAFLKAPSNRWAFTHAESLAEPMTSVALVAAGVRALRTAVLYGDSEIGFEEAAQ